MPTKSRRKDISVIKHLTEHPHDFCFKQAVRLLERYSVRFQSQNGKSSGQEIAKYMPPSSEFVRFRTNSSFSFPSSDIRLIKETKTSENTKQWSMDVNFIGLTGSSGVLPFHYTETTLQRLKLKDSSMIDFLNIFNHRTTSLFHQASCKYSLPISYERNHLNTNGNNGPDNYTQSLLSLIGLGTNYLSNRLNTKDESLIFYSGLFTERIRSASGLQQILQNHFKIPVEVKEFIGQWQDLIPDVRTRLSSGRSTLNNCLGKSSILGQKSWFSQGKIRIILRPDNKTQIKKFSPEKNTLKALDEMVRLYIGVEYDYDFIMRINKKDIPERVNFSTKNRPIMGWNIWLSSKTHGNTGSSETIDIPISPRRLT